MATGFWTILGGCCGLRERKHSEDQSPLLAHPEETRYTASSSRHEQTEPSPTGNSDLGYGTQVENDASLKAEEREDRRGIDDKPSSPKPTHPSLPSTLPRSPVPPYRDTDSARSFPRETGAEVEVEGEADADAEGESAVVANTTQSATSAVESSDEVHSSGLPDQKQDQDQGQVQSREVEESTQDTQRLVQKENEVQAQAKAKALAESPVKALTEAETSVPLSKDTAEAEGNEKSQGQETLEKDDPVDQVTSGTAEMGSAPQPKEVVQTSSPDSSSLSEQSSPVPPPSDTPSHPKPNSAPTSHSPPVLPDSSAITEKESRMDSLTVDSNESMVIIVGDDDDDDDEEEEEDEDAIGAGQQVEHEVQAGLEQTIKSIEEAQKVVEDVVGRQPEDDQKSENGRFESHEGNRTLEGGPVNESPSQRNGPESLSSKRTSSASSLKDSSSPAIIPPSTSASASISSSTPSPTTSTYPKTLNPNAPSFSPSPASAQTYANAVQVEQVSMNEKSNETGKNGEVEGGVDGKPTIGNGNGNAEGQVSANGNGNTNGHANGNSNNHSKRGKNGKKGRGGRGGGGRGGRGKGKK